MSSKELRKEIARRGYKPNYEKAKWKFRQILMEDDKKNKKPIPLLECQNHVSLISQKD